MGLTENHKGEYPLSDHPHDVARRTNFTCPDCEGFMTKCNPYPEALVCHFCNKRWIIKDNKTVLYENQKDGW